MTRKALFFVALMAGLCVLGAQGTLAATILVTGNITTSQTWTSNNEYILTLPIYVTSGATLTIEPGTVIRGQGESSPGAHDPGTLIITRGSKVRALGTARAPIVFTDTLDDNIGSNPGTPPYDDKADALGITGQWGGVILLGRGYVANNTLGAVNPAREFQIEGLTATGELGFYGGCSETIAGPYGRNCDDDDSGAMSYVSIRYGGFNLSANNEINGLTLGGVGRSTDIDHIEIFQNKDDLVELFGGAVNLKYIAGANNGDDGVDFDEGWRGKAQFVFIMQGTPGSDKGDKGGEHDGGNTPDGSQPMSIPTIYNATYVGLGQKAYTNKAQNTALLFRDNGAGRYYNSFFADFGGAPLCIEGGNLPGGSSTAALTSGERSITPYSVDGTYYLDPASSFQLELQDNDWWCFGNGGVVPTGDASASGCDAGKNHHNNGAFTNATLDNGYFACNTPLPIRTLSRFAVGDPSAPDPVSTIDPRPSAVSSLLTTDRTPPADGFYEPASYKGAFDGVTNWADGWTALSRLGYFPPKPQVVLNSNVSTSQTWTADNEYVLGQPIYVTNGSTLTINPGTVVRSQGESSPGAHDPGTLIITRGSKVRALGTEDKPIVFTDLLDDNVGDSPGTSPYDNKADALGITGQWGGVILLGRGYVANNTLGAVNPAREFQIEGLTATGELGFYGGCSETIAGPYGRNCDDDDSGALSYVSIRYGGFNLSANNEINGLTLGGVGRSTDIDHIEIFQNKDDLVELFGGAVNLKYIAGANNGDDGVDFDEGWRGKAQFVFIMQGTPGSDKGDKGGEHDGGNTPDGSQPMSIPTIYNATYVGLGQKAYTNKAQNTALLFRDNGAGRYYNSFFADFGGAPLCIEGGNLPGGSSTAALTSGERSITPYSVDGTYYLDPSSSFQLELQDNDWWCFGNGGVVPTGDASASGCDAGKNHHNNGAFTNAALDNDYFACNTPLPIRTLSRFAVGDPSAPDPVSTIDPRPRPVGSLTATDRAAPADGFFSPVGYKGAFAPGSNWAAGCWTALSRLGYFPSCDPVNAPQAVPDEVSELGFVTKTQLTWTALTFNVKTYDLLRSTNPADFVGAPAVCVESNDADTTAADATVPSAGQVLYYLARAANNCGKGTLGTRSNGAERAGRNCP